MTHVLSFGAIGLALSFAVLPAPPAFGQESTTSTKETTTVAPDGSKRTTTKTTTVEGKVVRYERGKTIVVLESGNREATYMLAPDATAPVDIEVGRVVSLSTENSASGPMTVTRITTQSVTPEGNLKTETKAQGTTPAGDKVSSTSTTVTGTVKAVQAGRSVTLILPNKSAVEYAFDASSVVPAGLAVGNTVTVVTTTTTTGAPVVVKKVTISSKTRTTKTTAAKKT